MASFDKFLGDYIKDPSKRFQGRLLALDPGETTGIALFNCQEKTTLENYDQLACTPIDQGIRAVLACITQLKPTRVVYEDYRVYSWKSASHSWSSLHTPKLIGAIDTLCNIHSIPRSWQMAQEAKAFCTDEKLQEWGFYIKGKKHTRDAIRHALFYLLFRHK